MFEVSFKVKSHIYPVTPQFDSKIFTQEMSKHASTETSPGQGTPPPPAVIVEG